jgi:hypothetical protein
MTPFEGITRVLMLRNSVERRQKAGDAMTTLASTAVVAMGQLTEMEIFVTAFATLVADDRTRRMTLVAVNTGHLTMKSSERVGGAVVVEGRLVDRAFPVGRRVTAFAATAESAAVRIVMTARTRRGLDIYVVDKDAGVVLLVGVAFLAGDVAVAAGEDVRCAVMIESRRGAPGVLGVTGFALRRQLAAVSVVVTGQTGRAESEEGSVEVLTRLDETCFLGNQFSVVAVTATQNGMFSREGIAGLVVVEQRHRVVVAPVDELELASMVLDVTGAAVGILRGGVQARASIETFLEQLVAVEAKRWVDALVRAMTERTFIVPFQLSVSLAEIAGRDLGCRGGR